MMKKINKTVKGHQSNRPRGFKKVLIILLVFKIIKMIQIKLLNIRRITQTRIKVAL